MRYQGLGRNCGLARLVQGLPNGTQMHNARKTFTAGLEVEISLASQMEDELSRFTLSNLI